MDQFAAPSFESSPVGPSFNSSPALPATRIAVVMGDPSGIGPEVLAKALPGISGDVLLIGDGEVWASAQRAAGTHCPAVHADSPGPISPRGVPFLDLAPADRSWRPGEMSPAAGRAVASWLEHAVRMALDGAVEAVVFAPLNKQAIIRAGHPVRDEYDLCAALAGVSDHGEMNVIPHPARPGALLWVARATSHLPLRDVAGMLTVERVLRTIRMADRVAREAAGAAAAGVPAAGSGAGAPRVGVAALNPHAGEGGLLGDEEARIIAPAIDAARAAGIAASGPHPADHIFRMAREGTLDAVVAMYHDQAQIATKLLGFDRGVSVGIGYPFILTTPSHGTAFDLVGRGLADPGPMRQALVIAQRLIEARKRS